MNQINLVPAVVQIRSIIDASVAIRLNAQHADGSPFDLSEFTVTAPFTSNNYEPPVAGWTVTVELPASVVLSLTDENTTALAPTGKAATWHWAVWLENVAGDRMLFSHGDLGLVAP